MSYDIEKAALPRAYRLGTLFLEQLEKSVASGFMDESETWLWGAKENAVSIWVKISANLMKLAEHVKPETTTELDSKTLLEEDKIILERYMRSSQLKSCDEHMKIEAESPIFCPKGSETRISLTNSSNNKGIKSLQNEPAAKKNSSNSKISD